MGSDEVFLFEYATCGASQELEPSIAVEGLGMFKTLLEGFEGVLTFVDPRISYFPQYPRTNDASQDFENALEKAEFALMTAPESALMLYNLVKQVEKSGAVNLGSGSKAVKVAGDKYLAYKKLAKVKTPKSEIWKGGSASLDFPLIAKPRDGVSCEGISLVEDEDALSKIPKGFLVQKYVPGRAMSASLLVGDEVNILSVNTQEIEDFVYSGAKLPVEIEDTEEIIKTAEAIKGLFGYIGIDFVLSKDGGISIIEINPRATTPIVTLKRALGINVSSLIMDNYYKEVVPEIKVKRRVTLKKVKEDVPEAYVSFRGYSLIVEDGNDTDF